MTAEPLQLLPLVECQPWCEDGNGHPDYFHKRDQACWSPSEYIGMQLEDPIVDDSGRSPQRIGVMARQRPDEVGHVHVHLDGIKLSGPIPWPYNILDHGLDLTPDEALHLARLLIAAAKSVRVEVPETG